MDMTIKNVKLVELNINIATVFLNIRTNKDDLIEKKYWCCKKISTQIWWTDKGTIFYNIQILNPDNNKFISFLRKFVYPYKYMDDWKIFSETSLPVKEDFYSHLNIEDITNVD